MVEHEIKLEKSVKIILGVLALGVLLNAFAPVFDVRKAFALNTNTLIHNRGLGGERFPVHIVCDRGC